MKKQWGMVFLQKKCSEMLHKVIAEVKMTCIVIANRLSTSGTQRAYWKNGGSNAEDNTVQIASCCPAVRYLRSDTGGKPPARQKIFKAM